MRILATRALQAGGSLSTRTFLFADLAGSERLLKSGSEGVAARQAMAINSSLTTVRLQWSSRPRGAEAEAGGTGEGEGGGGLAVV